MGNLSFASGWVAMGGFAVASGWAALSTRALPRGFGWWAVGAGICLIAARFAWTTPLWLLGYALLWMWVVAVCVRLVRRRARVTPPSSAALTGLSIPGATT